ncbi:four helix bundle protein [Neolewinella litorea]|uniref:Four helix bundle protein n=1 Tax=Neolewinella litorea TaxID=2562452 RepID=A0A4S4NJH0_9BACT|nr:four helix bundle protein [Neolewinella litorea]THH39922.1 four helix bundle protein [Neolewinella litorea]
MHNHELEERLMDFSVRCSKLCRALPTRKYYDADHVAKQLLRAATHAGFHYPEARSAESTKDFLHKLKVMLKELRESRAELKYIQRMEYLAPGRVQPLVQEANELIAMFTAGTKKLSDKMVQRSVAQKVG